MVTAIRLRRRMLPAAALAAFRGRRAHAADPAIEAACIRCVPTSRRHPTRRRWRARIRYFRSISTITCVPASNFALFCRDVSLRTERITP